MRSVLSIWRTAGLDLAGPLEEKEVLPPGCTDDDHNGDNHRRVNDRGDVCGRANAAICVDHDQRDHDQVAVDERDDAAEADAIRPEDTRERNGAARTNE